MCDCFGIVPSDMTFQKRMHCLIGKTAGVWTNLVTECAVPIVYRRTVSSIIDIFKLCKAHLGGHVSTGLFLMTIMIKWHKSPYGLPTSIDQCLRM